MPKQRAKLTERQVASLKAGTRDKFCWDTVPGFGVRVKPSGAKSFVLWYRTGAGTKRLYTVGSADAFKVEQARREAQEWLVKIRRGADPVAVRKKARQAKTISELCDKYLKEHVEPNNKPRTAKEVRRIVERRIRPKLGRVAISDLTRARVKEWHQKMRATPFEANRALAYFSKMMSLAVKEWELCSENPCQGISKFAEPARVRHLTEEELGRLGKALADAEYTQIEPAAVITAIKLLALTGCRLGEVVGLTWEQVDLNSGILALADAKAGARAVPLGEPVIALLSSLPKQERGSVVRRGNHAPLSASMLEKAWRRICKRAEIQNARLHDLRHTVGTYAGAAGLNAFMVRDLLGHKTLAMTGRYVESRHRSEARRCQQRRWADRGCDERRPGGQSRTIARTGTQQ